MIEMSRRGGGEVGQLLRAAALRRPGALPAAPVWFLTSASALDAGLVRRGDLAMAAWRAMVSSMVPDRALT